MNDDKKSWIGCLLIFAAIISSAIGYGWYSTWSAKQKEAKRFENIRKDSIRKAFIADSLAHDPHYQDSLRLENERWEKWMKEEDEISKKEIIGFAMCGDSIYHTSVHCVRSTNRHIHNFLAEDRKKLLFLTMEEIEAQSYKLCKECEETEDVRMRYDDGELFDYESAYDNDLIPRESADDYCSHNDY